MKVDERMDGCGDRCVWRPLRRGNQGDGLARTRGPRVIIETDALYSSFRVTALAQAYQAPTYTMSGVLVCLVLLVRILAPNSTATMRVWVRMKLHSIHARLTVSPIVIPELRMLTTF